MPYQNDMATLASIAGPAVAAQNAGSQDYLAQQQQELANQKAGAELPFAGQEAQNMAALHGAQANLAGAQAQGIGLENMFTQQTQPSKVGAANAENSLKVTQAQAGKLTSLGQSAMQMADLLDNSGMPDALKPSAFMQQMQQMGVPMQLAQGIAQGDPAQLTERLRTVGNGLIQHSASYMTESMKQEAETNRADITGQYHLKGQEASANARKYASDNAVRVKQMAQTVDQAIAAITQRRGSPQEQPGDAERLKFLSEQQLQFRQMNAVNNAQLLNLGQPSPQLNFGNDGGGAPAASGPAPDVDAAKQAATQAFGSYEPDKYEYGINPKTGKFARRPK